MRPAGLRTGAGKTLTTEGLHADDGADDVAVHVGVADVQAVGDALDGFVDAAVDAQRQAVAGIGDAAQTWSRSSARQRTTCRIGPKTSRSRRAMLSIS